MTTEKESTDMLRWIHVDVDGKEFGSLQIQDSETIAKCRNTLIKQFQLSSNTYFLNILNYRISQKDEDSLQITEIRQMNNTIRLVSVSTTNSTSDVRQMESGTNRCDVFFFRQMFAVMLISLSCYYIYTKGVCQYDHALPMLDTFCPVLPIPSVSKLAERSVILADSLITADVKAPSRFVQAKISLIELRMRILYSDIDEKVKNELGDQMYQLKDLIQDGADKSTSLLVSFTSTLDKLRMYTKFALEEFSQATSQQKSDQSKSSMARKLIKSYEQYLSSVSSQITRILHDAQRTSAILEGIKAKLETIQELKLHGEYISLTKIDELKNDWLWNRIFGSNKRDITKHERNLRILAEFMKFVNTALENANVIITKLKKFKNDAENLEQAELLLEEASDIPIHRHAHLLDTALERLSAASTAFEAKMHREIQSDETS